MKALILVGGAGTRLKEVTGDLPKPLIPIAGKPLLEHLISLCRKYSINEIHLLTGYGSKEIANAVGDGDRLGVKVFHHPEGQPLGTAGCVKELQAILSEDFLVLYGDIYIHMDLGRLLSFHEKAKPQATIVVHPNDHPYDSDLVETEGDRVVAFHPKPHARGEYFLNLVNAGAYVLSPAILRRIPQDAPSDFGRDIFPRCLAAGDLLCAYQTPEYLKDIGTPDRYRKVLQDYQSGRPERHHLDNQRRGVFLDRDGTICHFVPFLNSPEQLVLIDGVAEAIKLLNDHDLLAIVTTNQPQLARGELSWPGLQAIHKKMEHLLGLQHAQLDATYICPHHPDSGYEGEIGELKIRCHCRKPAGGMFFSAAERFHLSLEDSYVIGDSTTDIMSARTIGAKAVLVETGLGGKDGKFADAQADHTCPDLLRAVQFIIAQEKV